MPEHQKIWEKWKDRYFLDLLDTGLNKVPESTIPFTSMNEDDLNSWLKEQDFTKVPKPKYNVKVLADNELCTHRQMVKKTETVILPLSLENNATLTGTAEILEEFGQEFSIPCPHNTGYLPYDVKGNRFDIASARKHFEFMDSIMLHREEMAEFEEAINSTEKQLDESAKGDDLTPEDEDAVEVSDSDVLASTTQQLDESARGDDLTSEDEDADEDGDVLPSATQKELKKIWQKKDDKLKKLIDKTVQKICNAMENNDTNTWDSLILNLQEQTNKLNNTKDHYGRTPLHVAVELKNITLVKVLLSAGVNVNAKEGCGATPLTLAVINSDDDMCKLLLENFAEFQGKMFVGIPSPMEMAMLMENDSLLNLLEDYHKTFKETEQLLNIMHGTSEEPAETGGTVNSQTEETPFVYARSKGEGFPTAVIGDIGTCKTNRSVKQRNQSAYSWCAEVPGDLHAKGFLCEAAFKAHSKGGFHKLVNTVMKRPKLTEEAFRKRKFQEQNLNRIKEAVRDGSRSYGLAAVHEFAKSEFFPTDVKMKDCLRKNGSHGLVLLERFKKWLEVCRETDESHGYHQQLFTLFGPLLDLFAVATKKGDGLLRETVWVLMLPLFAQLRFKNYWTESLVHVVNFSCLWPLAFRKMLIQNSTVNLDGRDGHNIDLDEYVESCIVKPLKNYASGKQLIHYNLQLTSPNNSLVPISLLLSMLVSCGLCLIWQRLLTEDFLGLSGLP